MIVERVATEDGGWRSTRLLEVTRHHSGNGKLIKGKLRNAPADGLFPAFSASGQDVWRDAYEHEGDAIIVSAVGARCGKCFLATGKWSAVANTHVVWPDAEQIDRKFLWYRINDERFWIRSGSAQPFVVVRKSLERDFLLPALEEQKEIVAEIEKQFTRLEAGVSALRRVQANLKRYRAAILKAACEGKLVPTKAELSRSQPSTKNSQPVYESGEQLLKRILTERRQHWTGRGQYKEPAAPDSANLPPLPSGWTWAALEAVSDAVGGFAFSSTKFVDAGYQVVKMANIRMGKIDLTQRPSFISDVAPDIVEKYCLREGDLVVTLTGTRKKRDYGYVAVVKSEEGLLLNQRIARVRPFPGMDSKFLQLAMQAEHYRDRFFAHETGNVGQGNVGMAAVTKEVVTLPPLAEQARIVAEVDRRLSVVEELESVALVNLQRATRLRQSVLQRAFSGPAEAA